MAPNDEGQCERLTQLKSSEVEEVEPSWLEKPMHGAYHRKTGEVADINTAGKAGLKDSMEVLIIAAQEQASSTRVIEARVYHTRQDLQMQTVQRGTTATTGKAYSTWNQVAAKVQEHLH